MRRVVMIVAALAAVATGFVLVRGAGGSDDGDSVVTSDRGLVSQQVSSGDIDIVVKPEQLDDRQATFTITLDTHATELDADITQATLDVDGTAWPVADWSGDGPGGHHRSGLLRFTAGGRPTGTAVLTLNDLPEPVAVTWTLASNNGGER